MDIKIYEQVCIPKQIMCQGCNHSQLGGLKRRVTIGGIVHKFETCSNYCDAYVLSQVVNQLLGEQKAFDKQETHMMIATPKNGLQHTEAGARLSR